MRELERELHTQLTTEIRRYREFEDDGYTEGNHFYTIGLTHWLISVPEGNITPLKRYDPKVFKGSNYIYLGETMNGWLTHNNFSEVASIFCEYEESLIAESQGKHAL